MIVGEMMSGKLVLLCAFCIAAPGQTRVLRMQQALHNPEAIVAAVNSTHDGEIFHLMGEVEIRTDTIFLRADEATYNHATGEIEAHGDIKVTPRGMLVTRGMTQFGVK
jgi:lipopolysaccharide assembly outer membrane protein LptD (OstA)